MAAASKFERKRTPGTHTQIAHDFFSTSLCLVFMIFFSPRRYHDERQMTAPCLLVSLLEHSIHDQNYCLHSLFRFGVLGSGVFLRFLPLALFMTSLASMRQRTLRRWDTKCFSLGPHLGTGNMRPKKDASD